MSVVQIEKIQKNLFTYDGKTLKYDGKEDFGISTPFISIGKDQFESYSCYDNKILNKLKMIDNLLNGKIKNKLVKSYEKNGAKIFVAHFKSGLEDGDNTLDECKNNEFRLILQPYISPKYNSISLYIRKAKSQPRANIEINKTQFEFDD